MGTSQSVYIIILNWQNIRDTEECLSSISKISYENYKVMLVNNAESDFPAEIANRHANLKVINNRKNLGFAEANNIGIKGAISSGADYIFVLNNDTVVDSNFLEPLLSYASQSPKTIFSPVMYLYDSNSIDNCGGKLIYLLGVAKLVKGIPKKGPDYLSGACLFVKSDYFKDIGYFDQDYFAYGEDADWCCRAKIKGYKLNIVPESRIWHKHSSSTSSSKGWGQAKAYYIARNSIIICSQKFSWIKKILMDFCISDFRF